MSINTRSIFPPVSEPASIHNRLGACKSFHFFSVCSFILGVPLLDTRVSCFYVGLHRGSIGACALSFSGSIWEERSLTAIGSVALVTPEFL